MLENFHNFTLHNFDLFLLSCCCMFDLIQHFFSSVGTEPVLSRD